MEKDGSKIKDCKSSVTLQNMWNRWIDRVLFMASGGLCTKEWNDILVFGRAHRVTVAKFVMEYLEDIGYNWAIAELLNKVIPNHLHDNMTGQPTPQDLVTLYSIFCQSVIDYNELISQPVTPEKPITDQQTTVGVSVHLTPSPVTGDQDSVLTVSSEGPENRVEVESTVGAEKPRRKKRTKKSQDN